MSQNPAESDKPLRPSKADLTKAARLLLGCYRSGDASDPEVYVGAVMAVLGEYSLPVIERVVDPRGGLPSKLKWLPSIAELKAECEYYAEKEEATRRFREAQERARLPAPPAAPRPTLAEIETKLGRKLGNSRGNFLSPKQVASLAEDGIRGAVQTADNSAPTEST